MVMALITSTVKLIKKKEKKENFGCHTHTPFKSGHDSFPSQKKKQKKKRKQFKIFICKLVAIVMSIFFLKWEGGAAGRKGK